jgi:hypothetical protein
MGTSWQSYYGVLSPKRSSDFMIKPRQTSGGGATRLERVRQVLQKDAHRGAAGESGG